MNNFKARNRKFSASTPIRNKLKEFVSHEVSMIPINVASSSTGEAEPAKMKKATTLDMVIESIKTVGEPRKGASYQAIKKWITENKEVDSMRLKVLLKIALKKGIDQGVLVRPSRTATVVGARGYFKLVQTKPVKPSKTTVKKTANNIGETKIIVKKATAPIQGTKKPQELPPVKKRPVIASSKARASIGGKIAIVPGKKVGRKSLAKSAATKKPAAKKPKEATSKVSSKTEAEKPPKKALLKAKVEKNSAKKLTATTSDVLPKPAAKKPVKKVPLKAEVQETPAEKATATNKPTEMPLTDEAEKPVKNVPLNTKEGKNTTTKGASKVKAPKLYHESIDKNNNLKDNVERLELSDTELDFRKTRKTKNFSSDTELEISKREEKTKKLKKLPIRAKKGTSKV